MSMMFARRRMPLINTLLLLFVVSSVHATCWYPNGDTDDGHRICDPNASGGSTCCAEGFGCMSNGLCADLRYENFQRVLRGGCSDKDFGGSCNSVCTEYWPQGDEAVFYCGSAKYCCGRDDSCCDDSSVEKHDLGDPVVIATAGKTVPKATTSAKQQVSQPETTPAPQQPKEEEKEETKQETQQTEEKKEEENKTQPTATAKKQEDKQDEKQNEEPTTSTKPAQNKQDTNSRTEVQPSSTANDNESNTAPTTLATSSLPEGVQVSNKQGTETVTVSTLTTAKPANDPDNKGSNNTVAIAVGVGVGVGVVLFLILAAGCWYMRARRKREKQNNQVSELMDQHYENGGGNPFSRGSRPSSRPLAAVNGHWWRGSRQVHEMAGDRGIELSANGDPKEIGGAERERRESQVYMMSGDEKHLGPASKELASPEKEGRADKT